MKNNLVRLLIGLLMVALIAGIVVAYVWNKEPEKVEDVASMRVTVNELTGDYAKDEAAANERYLNKAIEVTGMVDNVKKNQDGATVVTLTGDNADLTIQCTMRNKDISLNAGEKVTLKGFCAGNTMFDVLLTDCIVK